MVIMNVKVAMVNLHVLLLIKHMQNVNVVIAMVCNTVYALLLEARHK